MLHKNHMYRITEFIVGLLFGLGLMLSGMTDPGKVIGFLDLFGAWDPSLALVMGGAILVGFFAFTAAKKRSTTFIGGVLRFPTNMDIDKKLVVGSVLFGAGWGMVGLCPGPALTDLASLSPRVIVFVIAMIVGVIAWEWWQSRLSADTTIANTALGGSDG